MSDADAYVNNSETRGRFSRKTLFSSSCFNRQSQEMVLEVLGNIGGVFGRQVIGDAIPQKFSDARYALGMRTVDGVEKNLSMIILFAECAAPSRL